MAKHVVVLETLTDERREYLLAESYEKACWDEESRIRFAAERAREEKAIETAIEALKMQLPIEDISDITGLSLERIQKLKSEMNSEKE